MPNASEREMLKYAIDNGIIDFTALSLQVQQMKDVKYLNMHQFKIWEGTQGNWYTYIQQEGEKRKLVKRKDRKSLDAFLIDYYSGLIDEQPTLERCFNEWVDQKMRYKEITISTHNRYHQSFNQFLIKIKDKKVRNFEELWLEDYCRSTIADQGLTSKRWCEMRTILKGTMIYARKHNYTTFDIVDFLNNLQVSKNAFEKKFYEKDQMIFDRKELAKVRCWIESQEPSVVNFGILLDLETGLRPGELAALRWTDITKNRIYVRTTEIRYKDDDGYHVIIKDCPKTMAGFREVVITPYAQQIIRKLRALNPFGEYVFMEDGERKKRNAFTRKLIKICRYCGITPKSLNKCRKTYATNLINGGVDRSVVIEMMGHTNIDTTYKFYYKSDKDEEEESRQVCEALARR